MENQSKKSNSTPLIIIGFVFVAVIVGGIWYYSSTKTNPTNSSNQTGQSNQTAPINNTPIGSPGAQPPHILGSPTALVTVEEFADFQCPQCGVKHPIIKEITSIYNNRIKFIFRNFPLTRTHAKAFDAAVAAEAAGMQNKFWDMQNMLFAKQSEWSVATDHRVLFKGYAQQVGLDVNKFETDFLGIPAKSRVDADLQRATTMQVNSTPSLYINGVLVPFNQMNVSDLRRIIDDALLRAARESAGNTNSAKPENANK